MFKNPLAKRERRINHHDRPLEMGVCVPQTYIYYNELEQYARYLELQLRFYEYDHMNEEERSVLQATVDADNAKKAEMSGPKTGRELNEEQDKINAECTSSSSSIRYDEYEEDGGDIVSIFPLMVSPRTQSRRENIINVYHIPTCRFNCGTAPCGCHMAYDELEELTKRYKKPFKQEGDDTYRWFSLTSILEEFDKNKHYKKFTHFFKGETYP